MSMCYLSLKMRQDPFALGNLAGKRKDEIKY